MAVDEEAFISSKCKFFPAGEDSFLAYNYLSRSCQIISQHLLTILKFTDRFRTVEDHKKALLELGWQDDGSGYIDSSIMELAERGLLTSCKALLSHLQKQISGTNPPPITSIVWPTRYRNNDLERGLQSYIDNNRRHSREVRYIVLDDSRSEHTSIDLQHILSSFAAPDIPILYAGLKEKISFTKELLRAGNSAGLPKEVVDFALFGPNSTDNNHTFGANLNALLLSTQGQLVLTTDDDIICRVVTFEGQDDEIALSSLSDPTDLHFYKNRDDLLSSVDFEDIDILHRHEKLLGQSISQILFQQENPHRINVESTSPELVHLLLTQQARIYATMSGICGVSGMDSQQMILGLRGAARDRLMHSESIYSMAKTSRKVLRHTSCETISDSTLLMSGNMGLDNRRLLPPFFPVGRNTDGLFATILRTCYSDQLIGHLPLSVLHDPSVTRTTSPEAFFDVRLRITDILSLIVRTYTIPEPTIDRNRVLRSLGEYLTNIGNLPLHQFEERIQILWLEDSSQKMVYLDFLLDYFQGQPDFWARDVERLKQALRISSIEQKAYIPLDLPASCPEENQINYFRDLVAGFGKLLIWWPTIVKLTVELSSEDIALVRTLE